MTERTDRELPKLPEPDGWAMLTPNGSRLVSPQEAAGYKTSYPFYTADQMRAYALAALAAQAVPAVHDDRHHAANEWADWATNGLQWLRNVQAGVSTAADAIPDMERGIAHCREVQASPQAQPVAWRALADEMPEPEVFVLTWDGNKVGIDWWGSLRYRRGDNTTHWCPFPTPPGIEGRSMYGLHSVASPQAAQPVADTQEKPE